VANENYLEEEVKIKGEIDALSILGSLDRIVSMVRFTRLPKIRWSYKVYNEEWNK